MQRLLDRPGELDHILIETSGLALPKPLLQAFAWPTIRNRVTVDGVVAVIDGHATASGLFAPDPDRVEAVRQADPSLITRHRSKNCSRNSCSAPTWSFSTRQICSTPGSRETAERIIGHHSRQGVSTVAAAHGRVDPKLLLGIDAEAENDLDSRKSHHDGVDDHDHEDFDSFVVPIDPVADPEELAERIRNRRPAPSGSKGQRLCCPPVEGHAPLTVQAVGERVTHYFDRPWSDGEQKSGKLVVIGLYDMDRTAIEQELARPVATAA